MSTTPAARAIRDRSEDSDRGPRARRGHADPRPAGGRDPALAFVFGDIVLESSDAIVNPAGAGLVDLAIRRAASAELVDEFHRAALDLPERRLTPGRALVTPSFGLAAGHIVHCGPPVYADDPAVAGTELASCHVEALRLARAHGFRSISFPAIGTGIHRFPRHEAALIAVRSVITELREHGSPSLVRFVLFSASMLNAYVEAAVSVLRRHPSRDDRTMIFEPIRAP